MEIVYDVHKYSSYKDAMKQFYIFLKENKSEKTLSIITGRGNNSTTNKAILRTKIEEYLKQNNYEYFFENDGKIIVNNLVGFTKENEYLLVNSSEAYPSLLISFMNFEKGFFATQNNQECIDKCYPIGYELQNHPETNQSITSYYGSWCPTRKWEHHLKKELYFDLCIVPDYIEDFWHRQPHELFPKLTKMNSLLS